MIFIDFDDTIFNTKKFKREYFEIFHKAGISKELFDSAYYFRNGIDDGQIYHYEKHLEELERRTGKNLKNVRINLDNFLADTSRFVFRDFWKFSGYFEKDEKILLSYGYKSFQEIKIYSSGISGEFKKVLTTCGRKSKVIGKIVATMKEKTEVYFLDDRPEQLEDVNRNIPEAKCFRIRRKKGRYFDLAMEDEHQVIEMPNLLAAAHLIKKTG